VTEVAAASETQPTTAQVAMSPKRISAFVQASKQAIIQGEIDVQNMLRQDLIDSAAVIMENSAINGSGSSPNPRGIRNTSGIGSVVGGTNGLAFAWNHAVDLEAATANVNAEPDKYAGYLLNTKTRATTKKVQKATNLPFMWDGGATPLNSNRVGVTNNVPSNLTKGSSSGVCSSVIYGSDWRMLVIGIWGGFDVTVDPYTLKTQGMVEIAINVFHDVGVRLAAAFSTMDDALTP
jgi:HK97 family phage major capsid protein